MKLKAIWVLGCLAACALALTGCAKPGLAGTSWQASRVELDTGGTVNGEDAFIISGEMSLAFLVTCAVRAPTGGERLRAPIP